MAPPPPLDALHVLATCVRHGSFSSAARELCLTPSAVSARIRTLEAQLGVPLFERRGPQLSATAQGRLLAGTVDEAVAAVRKAVDQARTLKRALRVTCAPAFATRWLVPRLAAYQATPGAVPVALNATDAALPPDRFDVAIRSAASPPRARRARPARRPGHADARPVAVGRGAARAVAAPPPRAAAPRRRALAGLVRPRGPARRRATGPVRPLRELRARGRGGGGRRRGGAALPAPLRPARGERRARRAVVEHTGNDRYWADGGDGAGKNRLGELLVQVREELRTSG
ncbi:MAG: LysR family transcriptional regulator [Anaeromyxobacter sp.]